MFNDNNHVIPFLSIFVLEQGASIILSFISSSVSSCVSLERFHF